MDNKYQTLSKTKASQYARLKSAKLRRKDGLFSVEGTKSVVDTIILFELEALVATPSWLEEHPSISASWPDRTFSANAQTISRLSALATPPEVIAIYKTPTRDSSLSGKLPDGLYLLLDGIQDPGNLGTIIRTAHWFGIRRIFASPSTTDIYTPKAIQASMGSIASVELQYCDLGQLTEANSHIPLCILDLQGESLYEANLPESAFIAMGSEGEGISQELRTMANIRLNIPPYNPSSHPDSLNVGIATAITLAEFRRQSSVKK